MTNRKSANKTVVARSSSADVAFAQSPIGHVLSGVLAEGSASNRSIADFVLRNPMRVTALKIDEMAEGCQVSTATISRFARDIGFVNYGAMRSAVAETLHSEMQPVDKLRHTIENREGSAWPGDQSMEYALANIAATRNAQSQAEMGLVVQKLSRARTVYVLGFGLSSHLAGLLSLHLQPFCSHVVEAAGQGGTEVAAGHLANIGANDVLVVISFPRYALDVIRLAQYARDHKACVISITDAPASPLVEVSEYVLYANSGHAVLPSSATAAVAVIEALAVSLMVSNKDNVEKAARLTEAISAYLYGPASSKNTRNAGRAGTTKVKKRTAKSGAT
ncbi:MurR/RpiR family transcriptional regulator [Duganella sp. HH101]|uniref:MurR/RpiR family transcriptional regulator n=1 Tax=Duganella sp. HH101 TaxID=1781066 RepID=UPI0008745E31|nr:MurR/RpiR family transcriptional regulator [Duganella sp. HH101]OFA03708.1 HTH-type transcriptional regulator MurR [Duganella sp. HH101]